MGITILIFILIFIVIIILAFNADKLKLGGYWDDVNKTSNLIPVLESKLPIFCHGTKTSVLLIGKKMDNYNIYSTGDLVKKFIYPLFGALGSGPGTSEFGKGPNLGKYAISGTYLKDINDFVPINVNVDYSLWDTPSISEEKNEETLKKVISSIKIHQKMVPGESSFYILFHNISKLRYLNDDKYINIYMKDIQNSIVPILNKELDAKRKNLKYIQEQYAELIKNKEQIRRYHYEDFFQNTDMCKKWINNNFNFRQLHECSQDLVVKAFRCLINNKMDDFINECLFELDQWINVAKQSINEIIDAPNPKLSFSKEELDIMNNSYPVIICKTTTASEIEYANTADIKEEYLLLSPLQMKDCFLITTSDGKKFIDTLGIGVSVHVSNNLFTKQSEYSVGFIKQSLSNGGLALDDFKGSTKEEIISVLQQFPIFKNPQKIADIIMEYNGDITL